jgi:hypothetical protein
MIGPHVTFKCSFSVYYAIFILFMGEEGQTRIGNLDVINRDIAPIFIVHH